MAPRRQTPRNQRAAQPAVQGTQRRTARRTAQPTRRPAAPARATRRQAVIARPTQAQGYRYFGCGICRADHRIATCKKFLDKNLAEKYATAINLHYCTNCLARNHLLADCTNSARCRVCKLKHHTILHGHQMVLRNINTDPRPSTSRPVSSEPRPNPTTSSTIGVPSSITKTFVPTAEVLAMTEEGLVTVRSILNPSLTTSRIAISFVRENKLKTFRMDGKTYVKLTITPNMTSLIKYDICWLVAKDLPKQPYTSSFNESVKEKVGHVALADPNFHSNEPVAMEIGGNLYTSILKPNTIHIDGGSLLAQDSTLGWFIMGSYSG